MSKHTFILTQDCWRWRLMNGDEEILRGEQIFEAREDALADLAEKMAEHPGALLAEERIIVERTQTRLDNGAGVESTEAAYKRGYDDAQRELLARLTNPTEGTTP